MRRTRILATLGPSSSDRATIRALLEAGADAFRLNFSHGVAADHAETCRRVRDAAQEMQREVAVLQDLGGPKIRTGPLTEPIALAEGATLEIEHGDFAGGPGRVSCAFDALFRSVQPGHRLLVDDGHIELEVTTVAPAKLTTKVVVGGTLSAHKGINVPGVQLRTSALTAKDLDDLKAGIAMGVDLVALSFVQSADDVVMAHAAAASAGAPDMPIVAKIEKPQAVAQIDEILHVADGLMVARGDLGIELPLERLPAVQKRIVVAARRRGVPVIVATQVLESMRFEPRPTRAEVNDAAHAVDEGVDAIMLAGETAAGKYPVRAVATLDAIIGEAESAADGSGRVAVEWSGGSDHGRAMCEAALTLAQRAQAAAIVAVTRGGLTARMLAALRPAARIIAATPSSKAAAALSLVWGVTPVVTNESTVPTVRDVLLARGLVPTGSVVVFVAVNAVLGADGANFLHVERL